MTTASYSRLAGAVFALIALLQLVRLSRLADHNR
jgi:hypothetical protein